MGKKIKNFFQKFSFDSIAVSLNEIINRFPLPAIAACLCFLVSNFILFNFIDIDDGLAANIISLSVISFFWLTVLTIFKESHVVSKGVFIGSAVMGILAIFGIVFFAGDEVGVRLFAVAGAIVLLVFTAPYIGKNRDNFSYWFYNQAVGLGIAMAFLVGLIFFLGTAAALASIGYLFEFDIDEKPYFALWFFAAMILGPFYALSSIPKTFETSIEQGRANTQVCFIANWILAPLVMLYMVILYAYFIKIAVTQDIPKNQLSYMIAGFAIAGIVTYMVAWVYAQIGKASKLMQFINKHFFKLLILPIIAQFIAIIMRIHQYGFTEQRYLVLIAALWFGFLSIGFILNKIQLKHIALSLAFLLFFATWGLWGMTSVSSYSQTSRLENLLVKNDILVDGKIVESEERKNISFDDRKSISSIVSYLTRYNGPNRARIDEVLYGYKTKKEFFDAVGFAAISKYQQNDLDQQIKSGRFVYNYYQRLNRNFIETQGADYVLTNFGAYTNNNTTKTLENNKNVFAAALDDNNTLKVRLKKYGIVEVPLGSVVETLLVDNPKREPLTQPVIIEAQNQKIRLKLSIVNLSGTNKDDVIKVTNVRGQVLVFKR